MLCMYALEFYVELTKPYINTSFLFFFEFARNIIHLKMTFMFQIKCQNCSFSYFKRSKDKKCIGCLSEELVVKFAAMTIQGAPKKQTKRRAPWPLKLDAKRLCFSD